MEITTAFPLVEAGMAHDDRLRTREDVLTQKTKLREQAEQLGKEAKT